MPGPPVIPIAPDPNLPARVDVVIIGGGIIGASTALELSERGLKVLLCEKGEIAGEQSSRNWGWVRIALRDPREIPLMIKSITIWEGLDARTGYESGYTRSGIVWPAQSRRQEGKYQRWAENLTAHGIDCPMLSPDQVDTLFPGHRMPAKPALYAPMDGRAEPEIATSAIARAARDKGCAIMTNCAVRSLDIAAGRIAGVITERGRVACDKVVIAGGAWSRLFAGNAGIYLPTLKILSSVMRTTPVEGPQITISDKSFGLRKRVDGGYTVVAGTGSIADIVPDTLRLAWPFLPALKSEFGNLRLRLGQEWIEQARIARTWSPDEETPFERCRTLDPAPDKKALQAGWAAAQRAFPVLAGASIVQRWAGMIDATPDALPVISPVNELPGLSIATGFSGHGFGIGPAAGRLMADLVCGTHPLVDPWDFRLARFSDASRVAPQKGD
ncbi:MAG: FAD-binding oxidoreductase [Rhodobacteraceae bacterium]|nr:FAD-binding oxidoreductase [Paracoccaceae bacterium]